MEFLFQVIIGIIVLYVSYRIENLRNMILKDLLCIKERLAKIEAYIEFKKNLEK